MSSLSLRKMPVVEENSSSNVEPVVEENSSSNVEHVVEENFSSNAEPVVEENFSSNAEPVVEENRLEQIIAETSQRVAEKDLEPPPQMSREDFAARMQNLNLSDAELDARQEEHQRRLEMNRRINEFQAELPDDLSDDERREASRIYTLREKEKLRGE